MKPFYLEPSTILMLSGLGITAIGILATPVPIPARIIAIGFMVLISGVAKWLNETDN